MNPSTARKIVPAAMVITSIAVGVAYFKKPHKDGDGFKTAWSLGALYLILALTVDLAPEIAGPLALLVMLGVALSPDFVLNDLLHLNQPTTKPPAGAQGPVNSQGGTE